jgi:glycine/D-amino acid oxidase-like deaminating enzyme
MSLHAEQLSGEPLSLWRTTANPGPKTSPLSGDLRTDVVIVGGGISGLSTALHLAEAGAKVVVVERGNLGAGASGRSGGQVIPGLKRDPDDLLRTLGADTAGPMIEFVGRTADVLFELISRFQIECDPIRQGWIQCAHNKTTVRLVHDRARQWFERGAPVAQLSGAEVANLTGTSFYPGGWLDRRGGRIHPLNYTLGLAKAVQESGANIYTETEIDAIVPERGGWIARSSAGSVTADKIVLCMAAYANDAWPGLRRSSIPISTFQISTEPLVRDLGQPVLPNGICVADTHPLIRYFRRDTAGRLIMGGPAGLRTLRGPHQVRHLTRTIDRLFPQLTGQYRLSHYWTGDVAVTADHLPHVHDFGSGVYAFVGCNGRGLALSTAMGGLLAKLAGGADRKTIPFPIVSMETLSAYAQYPILNWAATAFYQLQHAFSRPTRVLGIRLGG